MSTMYVESIMSKGRELLWNGNTRTILQWGLPAGAIVFAWGKLWAKVSGLETQLSDVKSLVDMLVTHLLGTP